MNKLLSAYLVRLKKDKVMWLFTVGMLLFTVVVVLSGIRLNLKFPDEERFSTLEQFTFRCAPYIGVFCSVIISLFLGREYSDGTIRNKLATGCSRDQIYLTSLIVSTVISELVALAWIIGGLFGIPHFGLWTLEPEQLGFYLVITIFSTAALGAIFNLMGVLIANRTASVVAAIFAALGMLLLGSFLYNSLCEPEMISSGISITADGIQMGEEVANPAYVGGAARMVFFAILNILPPGQEILIANYDNISVIANPVLEIGGSILIVVVSSLVGTAVFRKKDLK